MSLSEGDVSRFSGRSNARPTRRAYTGVQAECARALDALNAIDALEGAACAHISPRLCSRAQIYDGRTPRPWVGVLMWHRPPGYLGYKVLTLVGVWAVEAQSGLEICIGTKRLPFARPFFDPEAYHRLIGRDFTLYYDDDGSPPREPSFRIAFAPQERLAQREAVAESLAALFG